MVGLHLNLTEGSPLCTGVSSLVGADGEMRGKLGFRAALREQRVLEEDLAKEIREQLRQYLDAAGRQAHLHIDGHQVQKDRSCCAILTAL